MYSRISFIIIFIVFCSISTYAKPTCKWVITIEDKQIYTKQLQKKLDIIGTGNFEQDLLHSQIKQSENFDKKVNRM